MELTGRQIGPYVLEQLIGRGGMAAIYKARDSRNNRIVALKLLNVQHNTDTEKVERFRREAQSAAALRHPHIVPIYEIGSADGYYYIAMRYISSGSLHDAIERKGPLPVKESCAIFHQIASALDAAHAKGIVHRDVKPSNILISDNGTAYLADFGVARVAGREMLTEYGALVGTPEFMSPEQIKGNPVDGRSDIYSLGLSLYMALTGKAPFSGPTAAVLYKQAHTPPPLPRQLNSALPLAMDRILKKSLEKEPSKRYQKAADLAQELCRAAQPALNQWPGAALPIALAGLAIIILALYAISGSSPGTPIAIVDVTATPAAGITESNPEATSTIAPLTLGSTSGDKATSTPAPTRTPLPTRPLQTITPTGAAALLNPPQLAAPAANADIRRDAAEVTFRWQWGGTLPANQHFEIRFYRAGIHGHQAPFGWSKEMFKEINLNSLQGHGNFEWNVVIVRGIDGRWEADLAQSERRPIRWEGR
jgi:eukaryotic-like serine/threonine-protein kinase